MEQSYKGLDDVFDELSTDSSKKLNELLPCILMNADMSEYCYPFHKFFDSDARMFFNRWVKVARPFQRLCRWMEATREGLYALLLINKFDGDTTIRGGLLDFTSLALDCDVGESTIARTLKIKDNRISFTNMVLGENATDVRPLIISVDDGLSSSAINKGFVTWVHIDRRSDWFAKHGIDKFSVSSAMQIFDFLLSELKGGALSHCKLSYRVDANSNFSRVWAIWLGKLVGDGNEGKALAIIFFHYILSSLKLLNDTEKDISNLSLICVPSSTNSPSSAIVTIVKTASISKGYVNDFLKFARSVGASAEIFCTKTRYERKEICLNQAHTRAAIGSIMSRNGSHNIGSHVLSALSHNVGTMPDDRVLYQYIQHRMDYIATATTDMPKWCQPTMFVGELMRNFFVQRHLLDHIVESERLHAYYFQGHDKKGNEENTVRVSVRRLNSGAFDAENEVLLTVGQTKTPFVVYDKGPLPSTEKVFDDDVCLAIPAGVVGNHAFYTIIENVLRNAAKHGKLAKDSNLEIAIGFIDDEDKTYAEFYIWNESLSESETDVRTRVKDIRSRMDAPFIDGDGLLRREDWGLAEMKISAGLLQRRSVAEIGGLENIDKVHAESSEWEKKPIIAPILINGENGSFHFGYRFFVPKPKEILFVLSEKIDELTPVVVSLLRKKSIYLAEEFKRDEKEEAYYSAIELSGGSGDLTRRKSTDFNFSFVVLPSEAIDESCIKSDLFPFRLMVWGGSDAQSKHIWRNDGDAVALIPEFVDQGTFLGRLKECGQIGKIDSIKDGVYKRWLEYLESKTRDGGSGRRELKVLVNAVGKDCSGGGAGRSLISDVDVWKFVFKNLFRTTVRSFCVQNADVVVKMAPTFYALVKMSFDVESAGFVAWDDDSQAKNIETVKKLLCSPIPSEIQAGVRQGIAASWLYKYYLNVKNPNQKCLESVLRKLKLLDCKSREVKYIEAELAGNAEKDTKTEFGSCGIDEEIPFEDGFEVLEKYFEEFFDESFGKFEISSLRDCVSGGNDKVIEDLSQLLLDAYRAADVMLRKYSEKIVTLPLIYSTDDDNPDKDKGRGEAKRFMSRIGVDLCLDAKTTDVPILYYRHGTSKPCSIYNEGLSGSQSCMMQIQSFMRNPSAGFLCQLTESALMRILIVDERFYRFLQNRPEKVKKLSWMNVWAANTDIMLDPEERQTCTINDACHDTQAPLVLSAAELKEGKLPSNKFDVAIIHQGIIDKMLGSASSAEVLNVLENLKKHVPYVVVTTGRGVPANVPLSARVLPFSSIERHLFQEYPEKTLLVNAIMSLLPCGKR